MSDESATRREITDKRLAEAGWNFSDPTQVVLELGIAIKRAEIVGESQAAYAANQCGDYGLLSKNGKPLAVVEAKKSSESAETGHEQAKQYSFTSASR